MNATIEQSPIFIKGLLFSWFPIFFIFATIVVNMFRAFAPNKAMGLGVVAAGISEGLLNRCGDWLPVLWSVSLSTHVL
jgi:hypothetical protein